MLAQCGAVGARHTDMRGVAARRRRDAALGLVQAVDIVGQLELWPAAHNLAGVERLERHPAGLHALGVVAQRDGAVARAEVQAAGAQDQRLACVALERGPGLVGVLGQPHIDRRMVRQPDDPRVVLRGAAHMADRELLQAQHIAAAPGQPVGGGAADAAQAQDDVFVVQLCHCRFQIADCRLGRRGPQNHRTRRQETGDSIAHSSCRPCTSHPLTFYLLPFAFYLYSLVVVVLIRRHRLAAGAAPLALFGRQLAQRLGHGPHMRSDRAAARADIVNA
jgi:hypothetical protein